MRSWRAHPVCTIHPPNPLPLSLPAGTRAFNGWYARSVITLDADGNYRGLWRLDDSYGRKNTPLVIIDVRVYSPIEIDWSSVR